MFDALSKFATKPLQVNMRHWKGNVISSMDFAASAAQYPGTFYWDFHRANLHKCLLERAVELGAKTRVNARVSDVRVSTNGETATVVLQNGEEHVADLVVGADGINSHLREIMLGRPDPAVLTGDLAYRLLLSTKEMLKDPELAPFVTNPQVNYWMGPDAHAGGQFLPLRWNETSMLTKQSTTSCVVVSFSTWCCSYPMIFLKVKMSPRETLRKCGLFTKIGTQEYPSC
jgi:salicylate hydroxylase